MRFFLLFFILFTHSHMAWPKEKEAPKGFFSDLSVMTLCIIKNRDVKGYIRIGVNVLVANEDAKNTVTLLAPRLKNAYVIYLSNVLSNFWIAGEKPDLTNIKGILLKLTQKTLKRDVKPENIQGVYIESYFFAEPPKDP